MCMSPFWSTCSDLSAQVLEKPSAIEVQLSTRASASTLRSVGASVGVSITCEPARELGQGDFALVALSWIAAPGRCFERVFD